MFGGYGLHIHNFKSAIPPWGHLHFERRQTVLSTKTELCEERTSGVRNQAGLRRELGSVPHIWGLPIWTLLCSLQSSCICGSPTAIQNTQVTGSFSLSWEYVGQGAVRDKGKLGSSPCRGWGGEKAPDGALATEFVPYVQDPLCPFATPPLQCLSANQE